MLNRASIGQLISTGVVYGVALLIEVLSDNKNRTVPEIRHLLTKNNGNLGESGCVSWMFEKKGIILINKNNLQEEIFLEDLLELGIESYDELDDEYELLVSPDDFQTIIQSLENKNYNFEGNISLNPVNSVSVARNKVDSILNLINALEEHVNRMPLEYVLKVDFVRELQDMNDHFRAIHNKLDKLMESL